MPGRQAKILSNTEIKLLLTYARRTRNPLRNCLVVLLSAKAGLRAAEIAALSWDMICDASGEVGTVIELQDRIAKKRSGRRIPIHPDLRKALKRWRKASVNGEYVIRSERGPRMTALSVVIWFNRAFKSLGLAGCSSHSGRRSFITRAARLVHKTGGSLRDVQLLAGHRSITTTQAYIQGHDAAQHRLVRMI